MWSTGSAPLHVVYRLYQYLSVVNSYSSSIRCLQTVSVSICREQLQLIYTLFIYCISIYLSSTAPAQLDVVHRLYQYLSVVNSSSFSIRCMQTVFVSIIRQELEHRYTLYGDCISIVKAPAPLYAVCRLYQYLPVVNSSSSAIRCLQTVSVSMCLQKLQLLYTLFKDCISIYLSSKAPAQQHVVYRLYQYLSVVNSSSSSIRCLQTVSVFICRQELQLLYTLFIDYISTYLSSIAPAPLYAVCRLYQYLSVVNSSSSAIRCMQTVSVSSTAPALLYDVCRLYQYLCVVNSSSSAIRCLQTGSVSICRQQLQLLYKLFIDCISIYLSSRAPAALYAVCRLYQYRQQLQLRYTLYVDCISIYLSSTASAQLQAVYRLHQYLSVVNSSSSALCCLQTVSVSLCRQQLQLSYILFIDCISIYLSSTAPAPLYAVFRLYQYLSVVNSSSSAIRCMQTVSVSICRQQLQLMYTLFINCISIYLSSTVSVSICRLTHTQLQLLYTLFIDCISIYMSSTSPAPLYAVCRLYQYLSVVNSSRSSTHCLQTLSVSICRQQPQLRYTLYVDCISIVISSSSVIRCMQTVSGSICRQQLQLLYTLFIDCVTIYLSSTAPAPLHAFIDDISIYLSSTALAPQYAIYRLYQYLSAVNSFSLSTRCLQTVLVSICRQQLQLLQTLFIDYISIYMSSTAPAQLYAVCRLYLYLSVVLQDSPHAICRLYQYLSVVLHRLSSATRCMQSVSVSICRVYKLSFATRFMQIVSVSICRVSQAQFRYTMYVDCISIFLSCYTGQAPLHAVCRLYQFLSVVFQRLSSATRCMQIVSVSIFRVTQVQLRYKLYVDCISFVVFHRICSATRCMQTVSVFIFNVTHAQVRYMLYVDCISIYLSYYTGPAPLHAVCRLYQYLSVVLHRPSSATRCMQTVCRRTGWGTYRTRISSK